jgi:hypothetical protein
LRLLAARNHPARDIEMAGSCVEILLGQGCLTALAVNEKHGRGGFFPFSLPAGLIERDKAEECA